MARLQAIVAAGYKMITERVERIMAQRAWGELHSYIKQWNDG